MAEKILVTRSSMPEMDEYIEEIKDIWDSRWLTNVGPKHQRLQAELKEYLSVDNVDLVTNGHMALELSIQALGLTGEIITTPFTFASTTQAIVRCGLDPVFCDIDPVSFTLDPNKLESLITEKTSAIMPVHVYGNICDVEHIAQIANKYNLKIIYDAAHSFGVTVNGKGIASFGDVSCFSLHATKVFNSIEGGALCFSDNAFGQEIVRLKNFGIGMGGIIESVGANAKMNEFCAAMGLCNLRHIDEVIAARKAVVERYMNNLGGVAGLQFNPEQSGVKRNYSYFPVVFDSNEFGKSRDQVFEELLENNINARRYFYPLTSSFPCYNGRFNPDLTPVAKRISDQVLTLPLYADLEVNDVDRICRIVLEGR